MCLSMCLCLSVCGHRRRLFALSRLSIVRLCLDALTGTLGLHRGFFSLSQTVLLSSKDVLLPAPQEIFSAYGSAPQHRERSRKPSPLPSSTGEPTIWFPFGRMPSPVTCISPSSPFQIPPSVHRCTTPSTLYASATSLYRDSIRVS